MPALAFRLGPFALLGVALILRAAAEAEDEDDQDAGDGDFGGDGAYDGSDRSTSVYIMEHGFLQGEGPEWQPRGTLLLSGTAGGHGGGFEARLSDAKEFVQLRPQLQPMMFEASSKSRHYAVRMYSPESPKRVLQAAIPAHLLADHFEDWHDILEVTMGSTGLPVGLSYRVRHTLGLSLFDHTQVHLSEPSHSEGPRVPPDSRDPASVAAGAGGGAAAKEPPGPQSYLRKYWWVIIIVLLLLSSSAGDDSGGKAASGGAKGGGGGRRA